MSYVLASVLKRKARAKRKRLQPKSPSPPPSPRPSPPQLLYPPPAEGLLICVQAINLRTNTTEFMRFIIPSQTLHVLRCEIMFYSSSHVTRYVRHKHGPNIHNFIVNCGYDFGEDGERFFDFSLDPDFNGPFSLGVSPSSPSAALGSVVYCVGSLSCGEDDDLDKQDCHNVYFSDLADQLPHWNITNPLSSHWFYPIMGTVDDNQLYLFEKKGISERGDGSSKGIPMGILFDPLNQSCTQIPFSDYPKLAIYDLVVAPMGHKLLVFDRGYKRSLNCYDLDNSTWAPVNDEVLLYHFLNMDGKPISVAEHSTMYWLDKHGNVRALNWDSWEMFVGPVIGFGHDCSDPLSYSKVLLHLEADFFCLIWSDSSFALHITVLRICRDDLDTLDVCPHSLMVFLVACFCYHLNVDVFIRDAHLLHPRQQQQAEG